MGLQRQRRNFLRMYFFALAFGVVTSTYWILRGADPGLTLIRFMAIELLPTTYAIIYMIATRRHATF